MLAYLILALLFLVVSLFFNVFLAFQKKLQINGLRNVENDKQKLEEEKNR